MTLQYVSRTITPAKAQAYLDSTRESGFINRNLSPSAWKKYATDMREGVFFGDKTGETIKLAMFNGKEAVIDGQNRLTAVVNSGETVALTFVEYVDATMFKYIDGNKPRTLTELMQIDGSPLSNAPAIYSAAGYMLYKEDFTFDPRIKLEADDSEGWGSVLEYVREHYGNALDTAYQSNKINLQKAQRLGIAPASVLLYMAVRAVALGSDGALFLNKTLDYFANYGENQAPNKNLYWAARKCLKITEDAKASNSEGRVQVGQHADVVHNKLDALVIGWNRSRSGQKAYATEGAFSKAYNEQQNLTKEKARARANLRGEARPPRTDADSAWPGFI